MPQKVITRTNTSASHNVDFKTNKPAYTAPVISESYVNEEGNTMHILTNGNEISDDNYMKMWGRPKGKIITNKNYKGTNPCRKNHWLK
jgi:hypothetical protein